MSLVILTMPEDPTQLRPWLESRIAGGDLATLVSELAAVHGEEHSADLQSVLSDQRDEVLTTGLTKLSDAKLRLLLAHPQLLLELQELIVRDGGDYWDSLPVAANEDNDKLIEKCWQQIQSKLGSEEPAVNAPRKHDIGWGKFVLSLAAIVLLAVGMVAFLQPSAAPVPTGWGWQRSGALDPGVTSTEYLLRLSASAGEWFNQRPIEKRPLAQRINEFRAGCSQLILAEHEPLADADRAWLVERCQAWAGKFDQHLADLEAGDPPLEVRESVDQTVNQLIAALKDRAEQAN